MEAVAPPQTPSSGPNGVAPTPFGVDPVRVVDHLTALLEVALGAKRAELEAPNSLLHKSRYADTVQRCTRFASDSLVVLYIQKDRAPATSLENGTTDQGMSLCRHHIYA